MDVTLCSVRLRGVLPRPEKLKHELEEGFGGRWLVIASSGECLMDYVQGACDVEREVPLASLCSLATAMQQFIDTACRQGEETMTHAVTFNSLQLAICAGSSLSVLAVVAPKEGTVSTASLRYKAMEIHAALSRGELGEEFRKVVGASAESRAEKVSDYTLSSCLAEDDSAMHLPKELASAAQQSFVEAFSSSYQALLADALKDLEPDARDRVRCLSLFDRRFEFLALLPDAERLQDEDQEDPAVSSLPSTPTRLQLLRAAAESAKGWRTSLWTWPVAKSLEVAVLCTAASPVFAAAVVELSEPLPMGPTTGFDTVRRVLPEEVGLCQRTAAVSGMLDSVAKQLCSRLGLEPPAPDVVGSLEG